MVAARNLELCLPERSAAERDRLLRENFASSGIAFFEMAMSWWWPRERLARLSSRLAVIRVGGATDVEVKERFRRTEGSLAATRAAMAVRDPLWRMPLWDGYESQIEPPIADLDNAPSGGMAGSVTAALFLRRFANGAGRYVHMDIYGWQPVQAPGRPKGGVGQGARAILAALPEILA